MRFWQRSFWAVLFLFLIGFDVLLIGLVARSGRLNEQLVVGSARSEMDVMRHAIEEKLRKVEGQHDRFTVQALAMYLQPFTEIYGYASAFFQIETTEGGLLTSLPGEGIDLPAAQEEEFYWSHDGRQYFVQRGSLHILNVGRLTMLKDVSSLAQYRSSLFQFGMAVYVIVSILLALVLLLLLLRLTMPLRMLNTVAHCIAQGDYEKRVFLHRKDEIGEFATSFNLMADAVQEQVLALQAARDQRQWFIDSLAHELRTPVTAIVGYGELLRYAKISAEERDKAIDYIIEQGNRVQALSEKLLSLARLRHDQIDKSPVALTDVVARAIASLAHQSEAKHVSIVLENKPATVLGDAALLETLLINLIENAIRASSEGQRVLIRTGRAEGNSYLAVEDQGIGIAKEDQERISEAFFRVDPSRSRKNGGAGLGLALCQQICTLHAATMTIHSKLHEGCAVKVEFTTLKQV